MTRLRLLAVFLLLGAAPPAPPAPTPVEVPAIADAKAFLKVSCAAAKDSCADTTKILDDYLAVLDEALGCMNKACEVWKVNQLFERDRMIDEREHHLPPNARISGTKRPLLTLSLFVITAAGLALEAADPKAKAPVYKNAAVEAAKVVEDICRLEGIICAQARAVVRDVDAMNTGAAACEAKPCAFPEQERQAIAAETVFGDYIVLSNNSSFDTAAIYATVRAARIRIAQILARTAAAKLTALEAGDRALAQGVALLEAGGGNPAALYAALKARETEVLKLFKDASITSDRTVSLLSGDPGNNSLRPRINASAARLASIRGRMIAIQTARGFGGSAPDPGGVSAIRRVLDAASDVAALAYLGEMPAVARRPIPIDRRTVPIAPPANPTAPPILKKAPDFFDLLGNARSADPLKQADALRRLGMTTTLGDPSGRAPLLHPQNAGDTCAIVAQQQILLAHGLIAKGDPIKTEALLAKEAKDRGFYINGTPAAYQADLLVDRGLLVAKQRAAPLATLDAAVRRGGMIIASVDARYLWGVKAPNTFGHAILITGAEINRLNGETLGYYINDSGVPKDGAGRFVPIAQFKKAWETYTKNFAEVR